MVSEPKDKHASPAVVEMAMPFQAAQRAYQQYPVRPTTSVGYKSEGFLLMLTDSAQLQTILFELPDSLRCFALVIDRCPTALGQRLSERRIAFLDQISDIRIDGHLGAFRVTAANQGVEISSNQEFGLQDRGFDLILNLARDSTVMPSIPPVGCFVPNLDQHSISTAVAQLPDWVGEFDKPKYFVLNQDICAHAKSSIPGCSNCIEACATGAIGSDGDHIQIDPYLCQGCGDCATVCPSGAVQFAYPHLEDTLNRLRQTLTVYRSAGGKVPIIMFHDGVQGREWLAEHDGLLPINIIACEVEGLGSVGIEVWMAALAFGAAGVLLLATDDTLPETLRSIQSQLDTANKILDGMGQYNVILKRVSTLDDVVNNIRIRSHGTGTATAKFAGLDDKRTVIRLAIDFLLESRRSIEQHKSLPVGAPFGEIIVNKDRCTLCMSCVSICPEQALTDGSNEPKLGFIEANCVQCGICETACPEKAISLSPRYVYDSVTARKKRTLHQEIPVCCVECGKPFATQKMIDVISEKLALHPMFQGDGNRRLRMCEDCRVKNQFTRPGTGRAKLKP